MPTAVMLLIYSWLLKTTTGSCPSGYNCHLERETYVLGCKPSFDHHHFSTVNGTIEDIPSSATHLKITCTKQQLLVKLKFANLPNIQKLTLDNLHLATWDEDMFRGIANISDLVMTRLFCKRLENDSFSGLTNLQSLVIGNFAELEYMHQDMLKPLVSLQSLSFRYVGYRHDVLNYEDYGRVLGGITNKRFDKLVLYAIHSAQHQETQLNITELFSHGSVRYWLKHLDIGHNNLDYFWGSLTVTLPVLEYISLNENVIVGSRGSQSLSVFWMDIFEHPRLKTVDVNNMNRMVAKTSIKVVFTVSVDDDCSQSINITFGPQLQSLSLRNSTLIANSLIPLFRICFIDLFGRFTYFDISNLRCTTSMTVSIAQVHSLKYFNLQNYDLHRIPTNLFHQLYDLTVLLLGKNDIGNSIANDTETRMFRNNNKLLTLDLAACKLTQIPTKEFSKLRQLQYLNLSKNALAHFRVDLGTMKKLRVLNLSDNKLPTLSAKTRKELDDIPKVQVDISGNPLHCLCNNADFVSWTHTSKVKFLNKYSTFCIGNDNSTNLLFHFDSEALMKTCRPNNGWYLTVLLPIGILLIVISMPICVVYKNRWKCACCFSRIHIFYTSSDVELEPVVYERDAFICYNTSDRAWVCDELLKRLEDNHVSTIIHQRDFLPGSVLHDAILESINKCRYTVLVFSPDFLASEWCLFEMHLARSRIITQGRDIIVPIILREFPRSNISRTLVGILEKSYLKWSDSPDEQVDFWDKLITKLKHGGNIRPLEM